MRARSPRRTCIGCRQVADKGDLVRLVVSDDRVQLDLTQRLPGRGAYVHRATECFESAARGGLGRSFRRGFSADVVSAFRETGSALLEGAATIRERQS